MNEFEAEFVKNKPTSVCPRKCF